PLAWEDFRDCHSTPINLHIRQGWMTDACEKVFHYIRRFLFQTKICYGPTPDFPHLLDQVAVHGGADPKTENPRIAQSLMNLAQYLGFIADIAIRQEADELQPLRIMRKIQRGLYAFNH